MNDLTQQAVVALRGGNKIRARNLLKAALRQDPHDIDAWLWLSGAVDSDNERVDCLRNVLRLDPNNKSAARGYAQLTGQEWEVPQASDVVPPPAMVPMGEGAPPAALSQHPDSADLAAPLEGEVAAQAAVDEVLMRVHEEAAELEASPGLEESAVVEEGIETAAGAVEAAVQPVEMEIAAEAPEVVIPEPAPAEEEPRIKSWEELLGPSEADEPAAAQDIYARAEPAATDTQEVRTDKASDLKFVTGPSIGYGFLKLLITLAVFVGLIAVAWYLLPAIPNMYVVGAAVILAVFWVILLLVMVLGSSSNRYSLANDKLFIESGLFGRKQVGLALADVDEIEGHRTFMQKIGGVGDISFKTREDGQLFRLKNIGRFGHRLQELKDAAQQA